MNSETMNTIQEVTMAITAALSDNTNAQVMTSNGDIFEVNAFGITEHSFSETPKLAVWYEKTRSNRQHYTNQIYPICILSQRAG